MNLKKNLSMIDEGARAIGVRVPFFLFQTGEL